MEQLTLEDIRELSGWQPPLGVLSVYLEFDPRDRGAAWRTLLRNGLDRIVEAVEGAEHERRMAVRATVERLAERYENGEVRPPPRGEFGFVEVAEKGGRERWWGTGVPPQASGPVVLAEQPLVWPLIGVCRRDGQHGVVLVSAERVRLLRFSGGGLEELADWELTMTSLDWRERKSSSASDPATGQGVSSSGHDQYGERLEHNRERFLGEAGRLAGERLRDVADAVLFGSAPDREAFAAGVSSMPVELEAGSEADLISVPTGQLVEHVAAVTERLGAERERALVERALGRAGGRPGVLGPQETLEALGEGRVEHLVFDGVVGDSAEALVRGALAGGADVAEVRGEAAELLAEVGGVAGVVRY